MKFLTLIEYFDRLEATTERLKMFEILAALFRCADENEIDMIIYFTQEQLRPSFYALEIGMSETLLMRAIADAADRGVSDVQQHFKSSGDLGKTAEAFLRNQSDATLDVRSVYSQLRELAEISGEGSVDKKVTVLSNLLKSATPSEAKYISRFVVGRMRLGAGNATILEGLILATTGDQRAHDVNQVTKLKEQATALHNLSTELKNKAKAIEQEYKSRERNHKAILERGFNLRSDLGQIGRILLTEGIDGIKNIRPTAGLPIRMALCERISTPEDVIKKIGRCSIETKLDGFRCQVHKFDGKVEIFSRNLERTTSMFPEIVEATQTSINAESVIFEGEALSYDDLTGELQPFQVTIQRKRKHGIKEAATDIPLRLFAFDLLYKDNKDWTDQPYSDRRKKLGSLIKPNQVIELCHAEETGDPQELARIFQSAIDRGAEGIVAKRLDGTYKAGARDFNWIKLKRSYKGALSDTVDVCLIGYFKGRGVRAAFGIGAVLAAVYDRNTDTFKTVSRVGSGFSQEQWTQLRRILDANASASTPPRVDSTITPDAWVHPTTVVTVRADEITRSAMHTCGKDKHGLGYALRFPRAQGLIRTDKNPEDATTVAEIITLYDHQKQITAS